MKIVCEISGGADSAYATLVAMDENPEAEFFGVFVNYGQAPADRELVLAKSFCKNMGISLKVVDIKGLWTTGTVMGEESPAEDGVAGIYTPLRNVVLLAISSSYAESIGADLIITGSKGLSADSNPYSFKDSTLPFYKLFEAMLGYTAYRPIKVCPILAEGRNNKMTKEEVFRGLLEYGFDWEDTNSCFNKEECGKCNNCLEKQELMTKWSAS